MLYGTVVVSFENRHYSSNPRAVNVPSGFPQRHSSLRPPRLASPISSGKNTRAQSHG